MIFGIRIHDQLNREMVFSTMQQKRLPEEFFNTIYQQQTYTSPRVKRLPDANLYNTIRR
jgi:hypothetical protein